METPRRLKHRPARTCQHHINTNDHTANSSSRIVCFENGFSSFTLVRSSLQQTRLTLVSAVPAGDVDIAQALTHPQARYTLPSEGQSRYLVIYLPSILAINTRSGMATSSTSTLFSADPTASLPSVAASPGRSPLMRLPGEIKNDIYSLLIGESHVLIKQKVLFGYPIKTLICETLSASTVQAPWGLLRSCKDLYAELVGLIYGRITFAFHSTAALQIFFERTSSSAAGAIRAIEIKHSQDDVPEWTKDVPLKVRNDLRFTLACQQAADQLVSLHSLNIQYKVRDWPIQPSLTEFWARPLLVFSGKALNVDLTLGFLGLGEGQTMALNLLVTSELLSQEGRAAHPEVVEKTDEARRWLEPETHEPAKPQLVVVSGQGRTRRFMDSVEYQREVAQLERRWKQALALDFSQWPQGSIVEVKSWGTGRVGRKFGTVLSGNETGTGAGGGGMSRRSGRHSAQKRISMKPCNGGNGGEYRFW